MPALSANCYVLLSVLAAAPSEPVMLPGHIAAIFSDFASQIEGHWRPIKIEFNQPTTAPRLSKIARRSASG